MEHPQGLNTAMTHASYLWHLIVDKPLVVAMASVFGVAIAKITAGLPDHILSVTSLALLVFIDWMTKLHACRKKDIPITSEIMRTKGVVKLRDYLLLYIAGACTIPLLNDTNGYRAAVAFMALVELWSVAENLNDAGNLPFDVRHVPLFDGMRAMLNGGKFFFPSLNGGQNITGGTPSSGGPTNIPPGMQGAMINGQVTGGPGPGPQAVVVSQPGTAPTTPGVVSAPTGIPHQ